MHEVFHERDKHFVVYGNMIDTAVMLRIFLHCMKQDRQMKKSALNQGTTFLTWPCEGSGSCQVWLLAWNGWQGGGMTALRSRPVDLAVNWCSKVGVGFSEGRCYYSHFIATYK